MSDNQLYPFERNRYYAGKMLTSADFQAEQNYFNNKRQFMNNLLYGNGIICGCGVFSLDDLSILVESGAAIDGLGREMVVDSSVVKKLSAIEGFDGLESNQATLCMRYQEKDVHAVYAVNQHDADKDYEFNRISEGYQLFLLDSDKVKAEYAPDTEFLTRGMLMENSDYTIELIMPASICRGKNVRAIVEIKKLSGEEKKLSYHGVIQVPAFISVDGSHEVEIEIENLSLQRGEVTHWEYWMKAQDEVSTDTNIVLKSGSHTGKLNEEEVETISNLSMHVLISDCSPRQLVNREIGKLNLEMMNISRTKDYICLAELKLVRTDSAYIIEEVKESGIKKYITSPSQEDIRNQYLEYFIKEADIGTRQRQETQHIREQEVVSREKNPGPEIASGVLEIPLGENGKHGDVCYSGEIAHGLGKGNVYVQIGYENFEEDASLGANAKSTIYGNPQLFQRQNNLAVDAQTAVKVLNDKGSFVVAAKLLNNVDYLVLTYRWVAIKFPTGNDIGLMEDYSTKSISAETPTVVLGTKESYFFNVRFNNMKPSSITYEMTEPGSGEITAEGIYTAPAKEGVYEIRIYCTDMPVVCTYAYAIVKKKGFEDSEE